MELWRAQVEVRKLQAESTPISCCFSTASAPSARFSAEGSHRKSWQPDHEGGITKKQIPSICILSKPLFSIYICFDRYKLQQTEDKKYALSFWRLFSIYLGCFNGSMPLQFYNFIDCKCSAAVMIRGHSNVTNWKYYCKRRGIWEHTCGQMESWGRRWWIHFEGCPKDCLLLGNKPVTIDNKQREEKEQKRPCSCTFKWKLKKKKVQWN